MAQSTGKAALQEGDAFIEVSTEQLLAFSPEDAQTQRAKNIALAVKTILENIGEDPDREGLIDTPQRFAKAIHFLTQGYRMSPEAVVHNAIFNVQGSDLVIVKDIDIFSLCEHHLLPFSGKVHIGYAPNGRVIGLSKLARIAEIYSRRLQVQERITEQVAHEIEKLLNPLGVAVVMECSHMCMAMRGVQQTGTTTVTECTTGVFKRDEQLHKRFLDMLDPRR